MTQNYNTCPYRQKAGEQMGRPKKNIEENVSVSTETESSPPIEEEIIPSPIESDTLSVETQKSKKEKTQKQICEVIYKTDKKFAINFNESGISFVDKTPNKTSQVEVSYIGEFGAKSFEILSYKFI
jgi:hypothetical protein